MQNLDISKDTFFMEIYNDIRMSIRLLDFKYIVSYHGRFCTNIT